MATRALATGGCRDWPRGWAGWWLRSPTELEMGVGGQVLRKIFYLTCYEKTLSSQEKRNNNLTLKISSIQD